MVATSSEGLIREAVTPFTFTISNEEIPTSTTSDTSTDTNTDTATDTVTDTDTDTDTTTPNSTPGWTIIPMLFSFALFFLRRKNKQ